MSSLLLCFLTGSHPSCLWVQCPADQLHPLCRGQHPAEAEEVQGWVSASGTGPEGNFWRFLSFMIWLMKFSVKIGHVWEPVSPLKRFLRFFQVHPDILPYTEESIRKTGVRSPSELEQLYNKEVKSLSYRYICIRQWFPNKLPEVYIKYTVKVKSQADAQLLLLAADCRDHLHGHQTSHFHPPAVWFLHRRRGVSDQPAHLSGPTLLRKEICFSRRSPTTASDRTEPRSQVKCLLYE